MGQNVAKGGNVALVVAAGRGTRVGGNLPKQYQPLAGRPLLRHCLVSLVNHEKIDAVRVVIGPDDEEHYNNAARGLELLDPVIGGPERQDSVRLGLESILDLAPEKVLIHDGARPFVSAALIDRLLQALDGTEGAMPTIPVTDTLKRSEYSLRGNNLPRQSVSRANTASFPVSSHNDGAREHCRPDIDR